MVFNAERTNALLSQYSPADAPSKSSTGPSTGAMGERMSDYAVPIKITTGPVKQFEGKDYVSREDFEAAWLKQLKRAPSRRDAHPTAHAYEPRNSS